MANTLNLGNGNWATKENSLLGYNSENGNYKPLPFDFTRASNGTFINKSGLIETAANGVPRIDFSDSTSGALLLEPQRTNLITYSSDFSSWVRVNTIVTSNSTTSPDGTLNSDKLTPSNTVASIFMYNQVTFNASDYTLSFFIKYDGRQYVQLLFGSNVSLEYSNFDLINKTVTYGNGNIEDYGNDWYKISLTANVTAATSEVYLWSIDNPLSLRASTSTGNGVDGYYIYGAQLEQGSYATSLINTQGSAVTRVKDNMIQEKSSLTSITQGTFFLDFDRGLTNASARDGNTDGFFYRSENSFPSTNAIEIGTDADGKVRIAIRVNGFQQLYSNDTISRYKMLIKWSGTSINVFVNGVLEYTSTARWTATLPLEYIGYNSSFRKSVNKLSIFSTALTDAEAIALTTI